MKPAQRRSQLTLTDPAVSQPHLHASLHNAQINLDGLPSSVHFSRATAHREYLSNASPNWGWATTIGPPYSQSQPHLHLKPVDPARLWCTPTAWNPNPVETTCPQLPQRRSPLNWIVSARLFVVGVITPSHIPGSTKRMSRACRRSPLAHPKRQAWQRRRSKRNRYRGEP